MRTVSLGCLRNLYLLRGGISLTRGFAIRRTLPDRSEIKLSSWGTIMGAIGSEMIVFSLLLWLSFSKQVILAAMVNSTSGATNKTLSPASARTTLMLEKLFDGYDNRLRPNFGGPPCKIQISIYVLSMVPIKEIEMEVTTVVFFRQHWTDPRLAYGPLLGIPKMRLLGNIADQVWLPDTYFENDLSDKKQSDNYFFELTEEGYITYSHRRKLELYCPMNLRKFPMDEQVCKMEFESYSYADEDIIYSWLSPDSLQIDEKLQIPQYTLLSWEQDADHQEYITGNFTSLKAVFHFKRRFGFYLLQQFIPVILIVILSWVSFWIDERSVPARVSLGITTVLALTTLMFGIEGSLPRVGYVKAIDVFLLGNFFFVFATLLEYAIICTISNVFSSNEDKAWRQKHSQSRVSPSVILDECNNSEIRDKELNGVLHRVFETKQEDLQEKDHNESHRSTSCLPSWFTMKPGSKPTSQTSTGQRQPCAIDKHCRKLFPVAYVLFLSIYFVVYTFADL